MLNYSEIVLSSQVKYGAVQKIDMFSVFEWFILILQCDAFTVIVLSDEARQSQGRGW